MILPTIFLFIIGASFGSFLSVVIYRIHSDKKGIIFGKSECPFCHKKLKASHLIPIVSYVFNWGKCAMCKKHISIHYLLIELICGVIFVLFYLQYQFIIFDFSTQITFLWPTFLVFLYFVITSLFLIAILFYDLKYMEVPEAFTFPAIAFVFVFGLFLVEPGIQSMVIGGAIAGLFFGGQVWISKEKWLGAGDTQIGILMGLLLGWKLFLISLVITYVFGAVISVILLSDKKVNMKSQVPFAPFLVIGTFITLFFGDLILNFYYG